MKWTYLLINFFTILVPFIYSFHPKIRFHKTWKAFFLSALLVASAFVLWDAYFTRQGVWWFNDRYLTGVRLLGLPLEEVLFFICIPFSCVFTYYCLNKFYNLSWKPRTEAIFCLLFSLSLLVAGFVFWERIYTSVTFISTAAVCLLLRFVAKVNWFGNAVTVYALLLVPFFAVNGLLTGTGLQEPVVLYNHAENLNIRLLTIPVEDAVYGFELILLNLFFYKLFLGRSAAKNKAAPKRTVSAVAKAD